MYIIMKKRKKDLVLFKKEIINHNKDLWTPSLNLYYDDINTHSWFDIKKGTCINKGQFKSSLTFEDDKDTTYIKCLKIDLLLSDKQKTIINRWLNSCILMYNETIKFIIFHRRKDNMDSYYQEYNVIKEKHNALKKLINNYNKNIKETEDIIEHEKIEKELSLLKKKDDEMKILKKDLEIKYFINPDYRILRTYGLKDIRNKIISSSHYKEKDGTLKYPIPTHILDCSIKRACSNFKTCLTNVRNKNQQHFRIRKIKFSKPNKVMEIEPSYFHYKKNNKKLLTLLLPSLGHIKYSFDKKIYTDLQDIIKDNKQLFKDIESACNLKYNKKEKTYSLFIPMTKAITKENRSNEIVSIDLGERTFACCLSENEVIKICNNGQEKIKTLLNKLDGVINNKKLKKRKIKKKEYCIRNKIKNCVKDLHWKTISFLTSRYNTIIIGNLSTKSIVNKKTSVLNKQNKRIMTSLSYYTFRQRLEYKCKSKRINYKVVNESYTSKTCSCCGSIKERLGAAKIFTCNNCNLTIDRDINGCKGIYVSAYL